MPTTFIIGLIVLVLIVLAIYFLQTGKTEPASSQEGAKREEPKAAESQEPVDPFKSAVPPKE